MRVIGLEIAAKAGVSSVATANPGTGWKPLNDQVANQVVVVNDTGTALWLTYLDNIGVPRNGDYITVPAGVSQPLRGFSNAKYVGVRRADGSNTPVTARYIWEGA